MPVVHRFLQQMGSQPDGVRLDRMMRSSNNPDGAFRNLEDMPIGVSRAEWAKAVVKFFLPDARRKPAAPLPTAPVISVARSNPIDFGAAITWLGHSAVLIELDGHLLLADPMLGERASPISWLGPKRFAGTPAISAEDLPPIDAVILSHDHYDHLDSHTIGKLAPKTHRFITPIGVGAHLERWGIAREKITELDWWESTHVASIRLTATPAQHFSGRGWRDAQHTLWASWVVEGSQRIFFGGDSGYFSGFKAIGKQFAAFDLAMLECGAYNSAWPHVHMFPEQTAQAALDLGCKQLMPIHWASFSLSDHPWNEPIERLLKAVEERNLCLVTPLLGERFVVGSEAPHTTWWRQ